jgi:hypothetical protein
MSSDPTNKLKIRKMKTSPINQLMIRRVFRQGDVYSCGICRSKHQTPDAANVCLEQCWQAVLKKAPWVSVKHYGKHPFACKYCQRGYATAELASACARDCASKMSIKKL